MLNGQNRTLKRMILKIGGAKTWNNKMFETISIRKQTKISVLARIKKNQHGTKKQKQKNKFFLINYYIKKFVSNKNVDKQ